MSRNPSVTFRAEFGLIENGSKAIQAPSTLFAVEAESSLILHLILLKFIFNFFSYASPRKRALHVLCIIYYLQSDLNFMSAVSVNVRFCRHRLSLTNLDTNFNTAKNLARESSFKNTAHNNWLKFVLQKTNDLYIWCLMRFCLRKRLQ